MAAVKEKKIKSQQERLKAISRSSITMSTTALFTDENDLEGDFPKTAEEQEWLLGIVADNALFLKLNQGQCEKIVSFFKLESVEAGVNLITQGDDMSDKFYVIQSGEFDVFVDGNFISTLPAGACLGELGIVNSGPRTATCTAKEDSSVWAVHRGDIESVLGTNEKKLKKQRTVRRKRNRKRRRMLRKTQEEVEWMTGILMEEKLFKGLDPGQIMTICQQMYLETLSEGDILIKQGEVDQSFYIVKSGIFNILVDDNQVHNMGRGSCFGDLALVEQGPRTATCQAAGEAKVWKLDKLAWRKVQVQPTNLKLQSRESITKIEQLTLKTEEQEQWLIEVITKHALFQQLTEAQISEVVAELFTRNISAEKQLVTQGETSIQPFYVIASGVFDVYIDGNHSHSLPKGGCFGDLEPGDFPASYTCRANQESVVWTIDASKWNQKRSALVAEN